MNRRQFLRAGAAGLLALPSLHVQAQPQLYNTSPGLPASPSGIVLVELANLYCSRCRAVNDHFERLQQAARDAGHDLRFAPVAWEKQSGWPDRTYYATRDLFPATEGLVRNALFDGLQREGMLFDSVPQVIAYFERRQLPEQALKLDPRFNLAVLADQIADDRTRISEAKAARLIDLTGAVEVPVFAWVKDGQIIKALSPRDAADPISLVQLVLSELNKPAANSAS